MSTMPNEEFWPEARDYLGEDNPEPVYASRTAEYRDYETYSEAEDGPEFFDDLGFDQELDFH